MKGKKILAKSGVVLLLLAAVLQLLARNTIWFADGYQRLVYPAIVGTVGRIFGVIPTSVVELGIYLLMILLICGIAYTVIHRTFLEGISSIVFAAGLLVFLFTANCGINYYAKSFSYREGIAVSKYSTQELVDLCEYLVDEINQTSGSYHYADDRAGVRAESVRAMKMLGEKFDSMKGYYPQPKQLLISRVLSVQQLCGVYSPFTVEANFNGEMPDYNVPHTICHELSHLRGFMREDEANFIGYLACIDSDSTYFQYSGYLTGWVYAGNALAKEDYDAYCQLFEALPEQAKQDIHNNNIFWERFEGKVAEVSNQMNDVYLKANSQSDGVKSYGRMVDLMLAYRRE